MSVEIDPGTLDARVLIQRPTQGRDAVGQPLQDWETVAMAYANIRHGSGSEVIRADAETSKVRASIRIRRRRDVDASMRVIHRGVTYQVQAVLPPKVGSEFMDLVCEVVNG